MNSTTNCLITLATIVCTFSPAFADETVLHTFERQQLSDVYFSEGANAGDFNNDGVQDVTYGPYWFAGPDFKTKNEIFEPVPQDRNRYANHFFSWAYDFNGDGFDDIFAVGFCMTPAHVYENPGASSDGKRWKKHQVIDWVSNESPQFTDIVGDERPELICTRDSMFGFATIDWDKPFGTWDFHAISPQIASKKFGHGLGVGDVNGDGRSDVIFKDGWIEQPKEDVTRSRWRIHETSFSNAGGGAEMYAYDVDGDGDNDIITSHSAHNFGLGWYEQVREDGQIAFKHHLIMGSHPSENKYGVLFSELHSVALADMDGDGLKDIVTGKTYWSHHKQSPMWDAGAVVYWFKLVRGKDGIDWIPHKADGEAGIGRQVSVIDVNSDGLQDLVLGGMNGAHVLLHKTTPVSKSDWLAAQPKVYDGPKLPTVDDAVQTRGPKSKINAKTRQAEGAIEGELLKSHVSSGDAKVQDMGKFGGDKWSNDSQLWWTGARVGSVLTLDLPEFTGTVDVDIVMTTASDYGVVQLSLDDQPLGKPIDLFNKSVETTGVVSFPKISVKGNKHALKVLVVGANPKAKKSHMFALDYLRLKTANGKFVAGAVPRAKSTVARSPSGIKPKTKAGEELNLSFEDGTLGNWTATGSAFEGQPIKGDTVAPRRTGMQSNHAGDYWVGTYEKHGDERTGTLTSEPFLVSQPYASFLCNGGNDEKTRVELIRKDTGKVFYKINGTRSEVMRPVVVDLRAQLGQEILIRVVDEHNGAWGHINFDHFQLHESRPGKFTPPLLVLKADEYPHAGLKAEQAAAAMKLPDGFSVTVGASEPDVQQPIAMAIDDRGRVWIAEAYEYPQRAKGDKGRDRILIFEDTDGNGSLDERKVFADGLNLVSGLEVGFGGVWVGAAPYLMFIPDQNGDDVPDSEPKILLDGFGYQDTHETLNAFIWGPDGWLYGCHGVFTHSRVGKPGTADDQRVGLNAGVWRYHPTRHEFEVFAHGTSNPWGVDFNDHGQAFITACVIPHLYHMVQGGRYQRQGGQHFNSHTYRDIVTIADHLHFLGNSPHGGNSKSDSAGGGHAHAGAMIYLGDRWPQQYRNQIFMNNIHGQRLNVDILKPDGSGYVGSHGPDFLLTGDQASQILNLRYGPDGNAWMIDWYDMQACHDRKSTIHDRTNGRIYKINYGKSDETNVVVDLASASDGDLAGLVLHANDWYVRHSRRLLQERSSSRAIDPKAIRQLTEIATTHSDDTRRLRAAWSLHSMNCLGSDVSTRLLVDASPYVRGWAVQMAMESAENAPTAAQLDQFVAMARDDESPVVRMYLASAAQLIPVAQRWDLLEALTSHPADADDHNLPLLYWYAAEPLADVDATRALALAMSAGESIPLLREFMLRRIGSSDAKSSLAVLVTGLGSTNEPKLQLTFLNALRSALKGQRSVDPPKGWQRVSGPLLTSNDNSVRLQATALGVTFGDAAAISVLRKQVTNAEGDVEERLVALDSLLGINDPELPPTLLSLLKANSQLKEAAIRGLAQYSDPKIATSLIEAYPSFTPKEKRLALGTLCARSTSGIKLLNAIQAKQIAGTDLTADLVQQLRFLKSEDVDALRGSVWGTVRESAADKLQLIAEYKSLLSSAADSAPDAELGRAIFAKTCMKCHVLYGVGEKIGPDLTGSNRANLEYLLSNIVDPSAVMAKEYLPTVILNESGRVVTGLIQAEDDKSITLKTSDAIVIVPKDEIDERVEGTKSMMPDDQLKQFKPHEVRSLFSYLQGKQQTPMLATPENATTIFNGRDLTGWSGRDGLWSVENGEIVGRTDGLKRNEWLVSDLSATDFKLTLEIKLVDNVGNSGIQFRSHAHDGEVSGYQADAGPDWWGKLYEEHGRGLIWKQSGEQHIKSGEWNRYEIVANGDHIKTLINGQQCVDLQDPKGAKRGIIALQLHSGGPTEVRLRRVQLEVIK